MGHVLAVPYAVAPEWPDAIGDLGRRGFRTIALTPSLTATPIADVDSGDRNAPVALLLGSEGDGLSAGARAAAGECVRIPLAPGVDSLNVATAAAIALHRLAGCQ